MSLVCQIKACVYFGEGNGETYLAKPSCWAHTWAPNSQRRGRVKNGSKRKYNVGEEYKA